MLEFSSNFDFEIGSSQIGSEKENVDTERGQKSDSDKSWLSKFGGAFINVLTTVPKEYWNQAKALNGDPEALAHYNQTGPQDKPGQEGFLSGFMFGVMLFDDVKDGAPRTAGTAAGAVVTGLVAKKLGAHGPDPWIRNPSSIQDQAVLKAAQSGEGVMIMDSLTDRRFWGMEKWEYKVKSSGGRDTVVHYVRDPKTGELMDFKFKRRTSDNLDSYERDPNGGIK